MEINDSILNESEKTIFALRSLFHQYGYSQFRMSKFEEYDFYSRNKDFLVSDAIITFTDTNGKLMALKPDVTLSVIKNAKDIADGVRKYYYNENVYRVSKSNNTFRELMQCGLECIGKVDEARLCEVMKIASSSLKLISDDYVLEVASMDILEAALEKMKLNYAGKKKVMKCINEKNTHEIMLLCKENGIAEENYSPLLQLLKSGPSLSSLPEIKKIAKSLNVLDAYEDFASILEKVNDDHIRIDFSLAADLRYYNGIAFRGFIDGIYEAVLSGGQYDKLMNKMGKKAKGIGFAVYMDILENGWIREKKESGVTSLEENA